MTYQELVKYRGLCSVLSLSQFYLLLFLVSFVSAYLQQNANVVNGVVKDSNDQIAHCKRLVESLQTQLTSLYQELMQKRHVSYVWCI